jgi:hypothetical protein
MKIPQSPKKLISEWHANTLRSLDVISTERRYERREIWWIRVANKEIPQSLKSSFRNNRLVYKLNLIIIAKEGGLEQSLYRKPAF